MSQYHFLLPKGPLAPYAPGFWDYLMARGHTEGTARRRLTQFCQLSRWLEGEGLAIAELDEAQGARFAMARRARGKATWVSPANMAVPLLYLRSVGLVAPRAAPEGVFERILDAYQTFLVNERGLATKTVAAHILNARSIFFALTTGPEDLGDLVS